ncbi:hypothetical protein D3C84_779960 [compost metagenome]
MVGDGQAGTLGSTFERQQVRVGRRRTGKGRGGRLQGAQLTAAQLDLEGGRVGFATVFQGDVGDLIHVDRLVLRLLSDGARRINNRALEGNHTVPLILGNTDSRSCCKGNCHDRAGQRTKFHFTLLVIN